MDAKEFNKFLDVSTEFIEGFYREKEVKEFPGAMIGLVLTSEEGRTVFVQIPFLVPEDTNEKFQKLYALGAFLAEGKPEYKLEAGFTTSEAWVKKLDIKENPNRLEKMPREYEDREEMLFVAGRTINGHTNMCTFEIERDRNERVSLKNKECHYYKEGDANMLQDNLMAQIMKGWLDFQDKRYFVNQSVYNKPLTKKNKKGSE